MDKKMFNLHLKECEFRFLFSNNSKQNSVNILLSKVFLTLKIKKSLLQVCINMVNKLPEEAEL
jgi:hypothetical protein